MAGSNLGNTRRFPGIMVDPERGWLLGSISVTPKNLVTVWPRLMDVRPGKYAVMKKGGVVVLYPTTSVPEILGEILREVVKHGSFKSTYPDVTSPNAAREAEPADGDESEEPGNGKPGSAELTTRNTELTPGNGTED